MKSYQQERALISKGIQELMENEKLNVISLHMATRVDKCTCKSKEYGRSSVNTRQ